MKVLHIGKYYPPHWGGMETALKDICEVIASSVDLEVVVSADGRLTTTEHGRGFRIHRFATWGTLRSQPVSPGLLPFLLGCKADIVHLHEPNPMAMAAFLASRNQAQLVIHYHSDIVRQKILAPFYRPLLDRGLDRAAVILAGSQELIDHSPVLARVASKCLAVPFGVDLGPFLALPAKPASGPSSAAIPRILAVGRLSYYKGFHHLIEAVRYLPARLVIAGEGEMRASLEQQVRRLGLEDRVELAGRVSDTQLLALYGAADIFCLSSCERSEAFGLVQLEAMGAGLPVVSTNLPTGVRAINVHGETGLVVAPHDPAALASALQVLLADPCLRRRMGEAGRRRAATHYSRETMGSRILDIYASVVRPSGPQLHFDLSVRSPVREVTR